MNDHGAITLARYDYSFRGIRIYRKKPTKLYYCPYCLELAFEHIGHAEHWLSIAKSVLDNEHKIIEFKRIT